MSSTGINTLTSGTINGLTSLDLTDLTTDTLNADNIDGEFFSIDTIEATDVQVDNELELTNNGFITIGKGSGSEITITDTQVGFLDGITSNIQTQINNAITDTTQLQTDLTAVELEVDVLNDKTIYQSSNTTEQKTIFSNKLILSSLSNLDVGTNIQANTTNIGILTTSVSNLSTQQSTNTINIQNNALSIGTISGGPTNSLFDRVQNITATSTSSTIEGNFYQLNSATKYVRLDNGIAYIQSDAPNIYFYRNGTPGGSGQSGIIGYNTGDDTLKINNYQTDKNISIFTRSGSTTAEINLTSNYVKANGVDINAKFNTNDSNITQINSDILGLSNTTSSLNIQQVANTSAISSNNVSITNNLSKITTNTNSINALQTKVAPVGSIMIYAGSSAPTGWYICNGALISKSANIELWSLLGNTYLAGRSAQTLSFYLPDMRQLFVTGAGDNSTYAITASNKSVGDYNAQSIMEHGHNYERPTNTFKASQSTFGTNVWRSNTQSTTSGGVILPGGSIIGTDSENKPYCMAMNYIIKK